MAILTVQVAEPLWRVGCDGIIGDTLGAEFQKVHLVKGAAKKATQVVKFGAPGTSNDQQTPPLLAKKPWWSMVVRR